MNFPIAIQLYSLRDDMAENFYSTLEKVKELGYDGVEFAGLHDQKPADIKAKLNELGLTALSAHVPFVDMIADPEKVIGDYAEIGCKFVVIPYITEEYRPGNEKFSEVIEGAKKLGEVANRLGLTLLYHNHDFEFEKVNGEYALDLLYREVPENLLKTEIDTCWVNVAGENPSDYVRKYTGRAPIVHLKDFNMPGEKPENLYELIGIESDNEKDEAAFEFRPVGYGKQDFPSILLAAKDAGAGWVVVEQDFPSMGKTPLECAKMSIEYLKSLNS